MPREIGASGSLGLAFETTYGTFAAPTKFMPIRNENLRYMHTPTYRRSIRQVADIHGAVPSHVFIEGDIEFEVLEDRLIYFLYASRNTVVKAGTPNFTYTCTPAHAAVGPINAGKPSLSLTVVRGNGIVFGYVGCVVTSMEFSHDNGMLICKIHVIGSDEATQSDPTESWPTTTPFGAGMWTVTVGGSPVTDMDTFTWTVDDNGQAVNRLRGGGARGAVDVVWGERSVQLQTERDFLAKTEYDAFKAVTATDVTILAAKSANNSVQIKSAVAIKDSYEIGLSGQGDLIRAAIAYQGIYDPATSKAYEIIVKTQEDVT